MWMPFTSFLFSEALNGLKLLFEGVHTTTPNPILGTDDIPQRLDREYMSTGAVYTANKRYMLQSLKTLPPDALAFVPIKEVKENTRERAGYSTSDHKVMIELVFTFPSLLGISVVGDDRPHDVRMTVRDASDRTADPLIAIHDSNAYTPPGTILIQRGGDRVTSRQTKLRHC
ncbi:hypothetical protein BC826DRAFT_630801 [Russula brevipes]|nr:hypothetical protein BC826DRAFT_630801 [Russula brevipes]